MSSKEIVIVPKLSGLEWETQNRGLLSLEEVMEELKKEGSNVEAMYESHKRQKATIASLAKALSDVSIVNRDDWNHEVAKHYSVVIAPGGDNHLQYVARFIDKQIVAGLNSDPLTSDGVLDSFGPEDIHSIRDCLEKDNLKVEEWARLQVIMNGHLLPYYAMSEIHIRESDPDGMARDIVTYRSLTQKIRCTGFLICTGAGLTGWYKGIVNNWREEILKDLKPFTKKDLKARFVVRENPENDSFQVGDLESDEQFLISSLEKHGEISFDPMPFESRFKFRFNSGVKASISVAQEHSLRVAVL